MVGVSRNPKDFSASLFQELCRRGYDVVPVNPNAPAVLGKTCFAHVQDIQPKVDAVLLMTTPTVTDTVVADCAVAGVSRVWMFRATGTGAISEKAIAFCQEHGILVIAGQCPFMFLPGGDAIHRFHGFFRKITRRYPKRSHVVQRVASA
jgi:predicted CoA-binding protein